MLMSIADVCEYLSVSRRTVYRYMQRAGFPAPAKRLPAPRWRRVDIERWRG